MASKWPACLLLSALVNSGCTFITSCPTPTDAQPGGAGTGNNGGGTGNIPTGEGGSPGDDGEWVDVTANLTDTVSGPMDVCGNVSMLSVKPGEDLIIAGVQAHGLFASKDGGQSWEPMGTGDGSVPIMHIPSSVVYDPEHPDVFWEAGIYDAGLFKTEDHGVTFQQLSTLRHNEQVSIDFTDPERKVLVAGGHEQRQMLFRSEDGGMNFSSIGENLPANAGVSSYPHVIDTTTYLLGTQDYSGGITGIFRTTDSGDTWSQVGEGGGTLQPLLAKDGNIYWTGNTNGSMLRSSDSGETWEAATPTGAEISVAPIELPSGSIASVSKYYIVVSDDAGKTWHPVSPKLPFRPYTLAYSPDHQAFYMSHFTCGTGVADAILSFDYAEP